MSTVTVSAGRNVGTAPMDDITWETFTMDLVATVEATGHVVLFEGTGRGVWEGTVEQAFTIVATTGPEARTGTLAKWLGDMARHYGQDAIAVTVGTTVLAGMQQTTA